MMFDNCNECPNHHDNSCPFAGSSEGHKRRVCQLLRLGFKNYDTPDVELLAARLQARLDAIQQSQSPEMQKEMDYSRNDAQEIVNNMRPFNN